MSKTDFTHGKLLYYEDWLEIAALANIALNYIGPMNEERILVSERVHEELEYARKEIECRKESK